jgi:hypothetical protein
METVFYFKFRGGKRLRLSCDCLGSKFIVASLLRDAIRNGGLSREDARLGSAGVEMRCCDYANRSSTRIQADWDARRETRALRSACKEPAAQSKTTGRL